MINKQKLIYFVTFKRLIIFILLVILIYFNNKFFIFSIILVFFNFEAKVYMYSSLKKIKKRNYTDLRDSSHNISKRSKEAHPEVYITFVDKKNGDLLLWSNNYTHSKYFKKNCFNELINIDSKLNPIYIWNEAVIKRISNEIEKYKLIDELLLKKDENRLGLFVHGPNIEKRAREDLQKIGINVEENALGNWEHSIEEHVNALKNLNLNLNKNLCEYKGSGLLECNNKFNSNINIID